jgi:hypothetical protein
MGNDETRLDEFFQTYQASCPEVEPSSDFMPKLWQRIESRRSFWLVFERLARTVMTASAALCVLLLLLNFAHSSTQALTSAVTYTDALAADSAPDTPFLADAGRVAPGADQQLEAEPSGR